MAKVLLTARSAGKNVPRRPEKDDGRQACIEPQPKDKYICIFSTARKF